MIYLRWRRLDFMATFFTVLGLVISIIMYEINVAKFTVTLVLEPDMQLSDLDAMDT
jgi:hypothetical protein